MKSQANSLLQVAAGVLADIRLAYPQMRGLERDLLRLTSLVKDRGIGVFTLDLPLFDQLLLRGLEESVLPDTRGFKTVSKRVRVPRFASGLWLTVFDKSGVLLPEPDVNSIMFLRQLFCVGKKIELPCSYARTQKVLKEYHNVESGLRNPTLGWDLDQLDDGHGVDLDFGQDLHRDNLPLYSDTSNASTADQERLSGLVNRLGHVCDLVATAIGDFDAYSFSEREFARGSGIGVRHGPGAVSDQKGGLFKYGGFPNWPDKLQQMFPIDAFGVLNASQLLDEDFRWPSSHEPPSRLIAVPKTAKGPRLIAAEPMAHQWCQQLLLEFLVQRMGEIFGRDFVTIKDQSPSQKMVISASVSRNLATLDLSSASDRLSCWAIERAWRKNMPFLRYVHACRTRWVRDDLSHDGPIFRKLRKFATQGSALTFPMQSLFFLCCALAVLPKKRTLKEYKRCYGKSVRVFGDDLIVPKHGYADLVLLLHYLELKVNVDKSFHKGYFRESCGQDSYKGYDVTPVKSKSYRSDGPKAVASLVDTANNLFLKGYWNAARVAESIQGGRIKTLPIQRHRQQLVSPVGGPGNRNASRQIDQLGLPTRASGNRDKEERRATSVREATRNSQSSPILNHSRYEQSGVRTTSSNLEGTALGYPLYRVSFVGSRTDHLPKRWNALLQRHEIRATTIRSIGRRKPVEGLGCLLQYVTEAPQLTTQWSSGVNPRPKVRNDLRWVPISADG